MSVDYPNPNQVGRSKLEDWPMALAHTSVESARDRDAEARRQLQELDRLLRQPDGRPSLQLASGEAVELPDSVLDLLRDAVREMAYGGVAVVAALQPELTTQQAAELLSVSRQHFVGLLERGELPYHRHGTHRRVRTSDLLAYKRAQEASRRDALDRLTALSEELGLYDR